MVIFILAGNIPLSWPEPTLDGRELVVLKGKAAQVGVDVAGGSIVDFHLGKDGLNPLNWNYPEEKTTEPRTMGHFVCFDRWGQPSRQESKNGMPSHGEAARVVWKVLSKPVYKNGMIRTEMLCELPIGGMTLKRSMNLYDNIPVLIVREEITNINKLGRVYNIVQHPSIAPPFLDESVIVDSNAKKGFMQESPMPTPEEPVVYWPKIAYKGKLVDLGRLSDNSNPGVVSFVFEDGIKYGWVTTSNPGKGLLLGYIWKLSEYPWLNIWRHVANGKPFARGLEFGTTGLHKPFISLIEKGEIFKRPLFEYLDAVQTVEKSYVAFLAEVPKDFSGVNNVKYSEGAIVIEFRRSAKTGEFSIKISAPQTNNPFEGFFPEK